MVLPIVGYGSPVLRKQTTLIENVTSDILQLIENMWETMYHAEGVGLAAPQVNASLRLFVVDSTMFFTNQESKKRFPDFPGIKEVFINPNIIATVGEEFHYEEGCLSIPSVRSMVKRLTNVFIEYYNEKMEYQKKEYYGITGRIILHEYDHVFGKLFIDHLSVIKKKTLSKKLSFLKDHHQDYVNYPMVFF